MTDIRTITPKFAVAPQLSPEDMTEAAQRGFKLVINNRPDDETPGQPHSEAMNAAAQANGLAYAHIPVVGAPTTAQVDAVRRAIGSASGPVLAFCRSGTRSIVTWSIGEKATGAHSKDDLIALGRAAGYDLSDVLA